MFYITGLFWSFMISETFNKTIVFIKGGKYKQLKILTVVIKCVQICSKKSVKMNTLNITNRKPTDFIDF